MAWQKPVFFLLLFVSLTPFVSPPVALVLGLVVAFWLGNPYPEKSKKTITYLLQASVVLLGFGMNLDAVVAAGSQGLLMTVITIFGTLLLGYALGKILGINDRISTLISTGTAICGGSAIAATAPAIAAEPDEISISLGTIFILNSIALVIFPPIGHALDLSQNQFGTWAAIAIHDTSSVVGAAARYGDAALATATIIKLVRALWIAPIALLLSLVYHSQSGKKAKIAFPWFIILFLVATIIRTYSAPILPAALLEWFVVIAKVGLTATLFLIGSNLSPKILRQVGLRPLMQGVTLWAVISLVSLALISWTLR
jgi:uncharacterized integral membrane protein (TIGR00698 family)